MKTTRKYEISHLFFFDFFSKLNYPNRYLAKSVLNSKMVAESVFGASENTAKLDPRNNARRNIDVEAMRMPSRLWNTLLNNGNPYIVYRCILAAQKLREDPDFDIRAFCRPEISDPSILPIRKIIFSIIFFFQKVIRNFHLDLFVKKDSQVKFLFGKKVPILEVSELRKAVNILHEAYESQYWPNLEECYHLMAVQLNAKFIFRRKLCPFRPLVRTEFFTDDNIGNSVLAKTRAGADALSSQSFKPQPAVRRATSREM